VNPLKLAKKKLLVRGTVLKLPALGRCPKCGKALHLAKSPFGSYLVCSNPSCDYYERAPKA